MARVEDGGGNDGDCAFGLSYRLETLCRDPIVFRRGTSPNVEIRHTRDVFQGTDLVKRDTGLSLCVWVFQKRRGSESKQGLGWG